MNERTQLPTFSIRDIVVDGGALRVNLDIAVGAKAPLQVNGLRLTATSTGWMLRSSPIRIGYDHYVPSLLLPRAWNRAALQVILERARLDNLIAPERNAP